LSVIWEAWLGEGVDEMISGSGDDLRETLEKPENQLRAEL